MSEREPDRNSRNAVEISKEFLLRLLEENKDTEYGKLHDFANIHSIEDYQKNQNMQRGMRRQHR